MGQKKNVCFDWNHQDPQRGLLRTFIANNWNITRPEVKSDFYTPEQQAIIREIFEGIIQPDWHARFDKQLEDDSGGFGHDQSIAIFGDPRSDQFEFVLTGRHMTLRCDGNSAPHVAFGGPIFYGHAPSGFDEEANSFDRPGRTTVILSRTSKDTPWLGVHTHFSLHPGTPYRTFGKNN